MEKSELYAGKRGWLQRPAPSFLWVDGVHGFANFLPFQAGVTSGGLHGFLLPGLHVPFPGASSGND